MISQCWQGCEKLSSERFHWKCKIKVDYFSPTVTIRFFCQCFSLEVYDGRLCKWKQKLSCGKVGAVFLAFFLFWELSLNDQIKLFKHACVTVKYSSCLISTNVVMVWLMLLLD